MELIGNGAAKDAYFKLLLWVNWLGNFILVAYMTMCVAGFPEKQFCFYVIIEAICIHNVLCYVFSKKMVFRGGGLPPAKIYFPLRTGFAIVCICLAIVSFDNIFKHFVSFQPG